MIGREEDALRIDEGGVARPVGAAALDTLRSFATGPVHLLPSPPQALVLQAQAAVDPQGGRRLWLCGEIGATPRLLEVMTMIGQAKWRGELTVSDDQDARSVFFDGGSVVGATSTAEHERLGALLEHYGEMTADQVAATVQRLEPGTRFGDAAVGLGYIGPADLFRYLHRQCEEITYAAMAMRAGTFYFWEHFDESPLRFPISLPLTELLLEGVQRMDETEAFQDRIPDADHVPVRVDGMDVDASNDGYRVYLAVNGNRSVEAVAAAAGTTVFEATRQLYALCGQGAVTVRSPRAAGLAGVVDAFNEAVALIFHEVDRYPGARHELSASLASFVRAGQGHGRVLHGAGPNRDGTFDPARVLANLGAMDGLDDPASSLGEWLYDYASFTMFIAEPVLRKGSESDSVEVAGRVATLLAPIAP